MTIVVNFFPGPGVGKTTMATRVFSELKFEGVNAEYSGEYAKELEWAQRHREMRNQEYIFAKQNQRLSRLVDAGVDVIVTDGPLFLGLAYTDPSSPKYIAGLDEVIFNCFSGYQNMNFLLSRSKPYMMKGRRQTESEAVEMDERIKSMLNSHEVDFHPYEFGRRSADSIARLVMNKIGHPYQEA
jgi:adenylate kinase